MHELALRSSLVSCKIFEPLGFRIQQLGSTPSKGHHFGAKSSQSTLDGSTPLISGSGILDPDGLSFCTIYTCQLDEIHYLETRSRCVNTSFIILGFRKYLAFQRSFSSCCCSYSNSPPPPPLP